MQDITDRKRAEQTLQEWQKRLYLAQKAGLRIGLWDWDVVAGTVTWSDEIYRQFGLTADTFTGRVADAVVRIHPEDRPGLRGKSKKFWGVLVPSSPPNIELYGPTEPHAGSMPTA